MRQDLVAIVKEAAAMGAAEAIGRLVPESDRISQRKAEAMFGRAFLRRNADRLNTVRNGNRREFSRSECERVRYGESVAGMVARIEAQYFDKLKKIG